MHHYQRVGPQDEHNTTAKNLKILTHEAIWIIHLPWIMIVEKNKTEKRNCTQDLKSQCNDTNQVNWWSCFLFLKVLLKEEI